MRVVARCSSAYGSGSPHAQQYFACAFLTCVPHSQQYDTDAALDGDDDDDDDEDAAAMHSAAARDDDAHALMSSADGAASVRRPSHFIDSSHARRNSSFSAWAFLRFLLISL